MAVDHSPVGDSLVAEADSPEVAGNSRKVVDLHNLLEVAVDNRMVDHSRLAAANPGCNLGTEPDSQTGPAVRCPAVEVLVGGEEAALVRRTWLLMDRSP